MRILVAGGLRQNYFYLPKILYALKTQRGLPDSVLIIDQEEKQGLSYLSAEDFLLTLQASLHARFFIMPNKTSWITIDSMLYVYVKEQAFPPQVMTLLRVRSFEKKVVLLTRCTSTMLYRLPTYFYCLAAILIVSSVYKSPKIIRIPILQSGNCECKKLNELTISEAFVEQFRELAC